MVRVAQAVLVRPDGCLRALHLAHLEGRSDHGIVRPVATPFSGVSIFPEATFKGVVRYGSI